MFAKIIRLVLVLGLVWTTVGGAQAQAPTGSHFPNRFTGRQLIVTAGTDDKRPEYRLLDNGLLFYREGTEGAFLQFGQQSKDQTLAWFRRAEQDLKIKATTAEKPEKPEGSVAWKKGKVEFVVAWASAKTAPDGYRAFYDEFLKLFPKKKK